ncbi:MAG: DivIVA domain-containing protein [Desulfosporosinus sp.]|nr:DivIVA domain-containing protein [Desulfosporosinus sp.]
MEAPDFKRVMRGYEPEAVDQAWAETDRLLYESYAANKELRLQINGLREQNLEWGNRLKYFEQIEKDLRDAMVSAQRISNQVKEEATQQASELIQSARVESEKLLNDATRNAELKEIETETSLIDKRTEILQLEGEIQRLAEKKTELQTLVDQAIHYLKMVTGLLGPAKVPSEQDSE